MAKYHSLVQRAAAQNVDNSSAQTEQDDADQPQDKETSTHGRAWETGAGKRFPWAAGAACLLAIMGTAACVGVLAVADNTPISTWHVAPSVILAILAVVVNTSLAFALAEAVNYRWWIQALAGGSTLNDLERVWMYGTSFGAALMAGKHVNHVALASVAITILAIDGPLLQRAISTTVRDISISQSPVNITLANQIPLGYSGMDLTGETGGFLASPLVTERFQEVVRQYQQREPIVAHSITGCQGICSGDLQGAGFQVDCVESTSTKQWWSPDRGNESIVGYGGEALVPSPGQIFGVSFEWSGDRKFVKSKKYTDYRPLRVVDGRPTDEPFIYMNLTWSPNGTIPDAETLSTSTINPNQMYTNSIHQKQCKLYPGSASYPVVIRNASATHKGQDQAPAANTIELQGNSTFIPDSFQNTPKIIIDAIKSRSDIEAERRPYQNISDLALPDSYQFIDLVGGKLETLRLRRYATLSGIAKFLQDALGSQANIIMGGGENFMHDVGTAPPERNGTDTETVLVAENSGALVSQLLNKDSPSFKDRRLVMPILFFDDPTSIVVSAIDEIMFRIAVQTAFDNALGGRYELVLMSSYNITVDPGEIYNDTYSRPSSTRETISSTPFNETQFPRSRLVNMDVVQSVQVYKASYAFLGGAVAVMLLAVVVVMPLFHGFWRLGRQPSLSPLETATALGAPLLVATVSSSNATASEIMKTAGGQHVQYGECKTPSPEGDDGANVSRHLQFGQAGEVDRPTNGTVYS